MCDRTKSDVETVNEAIVDLKWRIADIRDEKGSLELRARDYRDAAKAARREVAILRERIREEKQTLKALRAELRELKPSKPRKAKGFPVTEYFEPSPALQTVSVASVTADFERYSNGFNVYD